VLQIFPTQNGEALFLVQGGFERMSWYAIHVKTGREDIVCGEIRKQVALVGYDAEYELLVPKRQLQERRQGEFYEVTRTMFPGYVLVQSDNIINLAEVAKKGNGILRFLQSEGKFQKINPVEIMAVFELINDEGVIECSVAEVGNGVVRVVSGPLKGHEGWVRKIDMHKRRATVAFWFSGNTHLVSLGINICSLSKTN